MAAYFDRYGYVEVKSSETPMVGGPAKGRECKMIWWHFLLILLFIIVLLSAALGAQPAVGWFMNTFLRKAENATYKKGDE